MSMGLLDFLRKKKKEKGEKKEEKVEVKEEVGEGPECALCGKPGADTKWGGMYWHKKCLRKAKKMAKGMLR